MTLDSLTPLLKLLPSMSFNNVYVSHSFVTCPFNANDIPVLTCGSLQADDWARFDSYACRVKEFVYKGPDNQVDPSVYFRIVQLRATPLLPALRRFLCSSRDLLIPDIFLLHSPSLRQVEIKFDNRKQECTIGVFLSVLSSGVSCLEHLVIDGQLLASSLRSITGLIRLRSLELCRMGSAVDAQSLMQLGNMERLISLRIDLQYSGISDTDSHSLRRRLKRLERLHISGDLKSTAWVLKEISSDRLVSVSISRSSNPDWYYFTDDSSD